MVTGTGFRVGSAGYRSQVEPIVNPEILCTRPPVLQVPTGINGPGIRGCPHISRDPRVYTRLLLLGGGGIRGEAGDLALESRKAVTS
jgi:hypothetical protein